MKIRHWVVIILFVLLATVFGLYAMSKKHDAKVPLDEIYPENIIANYYSSLDERMGKNIPFLVLSEKPYLRWELYNDKAEPGHRITSQMVKNIKSMKMVSKRELDYEGKPITFPRRDGSIETFPLEDTVLYEVTYNISYFSTKKAKYMYGEYGNKGYKDTGKKLYKNKKEKVWLVKIKNGAWRIAKFELIPD